MDFITNLPTGKHNISEVYVKLTMGPSVKIEGAGEGKASKKGAEKESKEELIKDVTGAQEDEKRLQSSASQNKEEKIKTKEENPKKKNNKKDE